MDSAERQDGRGHSKFLVDKVITLDAQIFDDKDGNTYVYWGTWGIYPEHGCGVGRLGRDMKSIIDPRKIPNPQIVDFF